MLQFLKFDQIFERNQREQYFWKLTKRCNQSFGQKSLSKWAQFLHKSIKICEIYNSRMQVKSKPIDVPLSAVTMHYCRIIS